MLRGLLLNGVGLMTSKAGEVGRLGGHIHCRNTMRLFLEAQPL